MSETKLQYPNIRALSWREPFASLMLPPFNKIETRPWPTKYRGHVLICASQKAYPWNKVRDICGPDQFDRILDITQRSDFSFSKDGHAIAIGNLVDCRPMTPADEDKCFVQYFPALWCHVYEEVQPIIPFTFKGKQGWSILTPEDINLIQVIS